MTASSSTWRRTSPTSRSSTSSTAAATRPSRPTSPRRSSPRNPDLKGIYGSNEGSAIGVVQAVKELGIDPAQLIVVGFDSGKAQIDAIRDGLMAGAITQNPVGIGYETVKAAVEAIDGKDAAEDDRHRLLLVRRDQHRRRGDRGRPLRVDGAMTPRAPGASRRPVGAFTGRVVAQSASAATARRREMCTTVSAWASSASPRCERVDDRLVLREGAVDGVLLGEAAPDARAHGVARQRVDEAARGTSCRPRSAMAPWNSRSWATRPSTSSTSST